MIDAGALKKISRANPASDFAFPAGVRFDAPNGTELSGTFGESEQVTVVEGRLRAKDGKTEFPVMLSAGWTQRNQMKSWFDGNETIDSRGQRVLEFYLSSAGKLKCRKERGRITPPSILPPYGMVSEQTAALQALMGEAVFSNPKPVAMLRDFVSWFTGENDLIMDFFAGSGTTGHAVLAQNAVDGGQRRFVLVQLPERLSLANPEQETAARFCDRLGRPRSIAELTKERLRRAAAELASEGEVSSDLGFRVYKLAPSNLRPWEPGEDLAADLLAAADNILPGRTKEDLLAELLLKYGIDLTEPMLTRVVCQRPVHAFGGGALVVYLDDVSRADAEPLADGIAEWVEELAPASPATIFFRDSGFADDVAKANVAAILDQRLEKQLLKVRSL